MSEFPKVFYSGSIISVRRFLGCIKTSYFHVFAIAHQGCLPFISVFTPPNSLESTSVSFTFLHVAMILRHSSFPDILSAIIERVVIFMVYVTRRRINDNTMHKNSFSGFIPLGIETTGICAPHGLPIPFREPLKISGIDNRVLIARKRNQAVGFIKRLNNRVAFHALFHWSSLKGPLEFSRYFSTFGDSPSHP